MWPQNNCIYLIVTAENWEIAETKTHIPHAKTCRSKNENLWKKFSFKNRFLKIKNYSFFAPLAIPKWVYSLLQFDFFMTWRKGRKCETLPGTSFKSLSVLFQWKNVLNCQIHKDLVLFQVFQIVVKTCARLKTWFKTCQV